jgi:hypothetical protein
MDLEAEIEALNRQNRRLKLTLFSTIALLLIVVASVTGIAGIAAGRARAEELRAREMAERARARAEAALAVAQDAVKNIDAKNEGGR